MLIKLDGREIFTGSTAPRTVALLLTCDLFAVDNFYWIVPVDGGGVYSLCFKSYIFSTSEVKIVWRYINSIVTVVKHRGQ